MPNIRLLKIHLQKHFLKLVNNSASLNDVNHSCDVVWISDLNWHRCCNFNLPFFSLVLVSIENIGVLVYIEYQTQKTTFHHISNTLNFVKNSLLCVIFLTLLSIFRNVVKHGLSCLICYIIDAIIVVCYSFKDVRAKLWHIFNLTSRICMGYPFHFRDILWSALKSLKTYYICNCLAHKHGLVLQNERCTAHVLICGCHADMQQVQHDQECDYSEWMCVQEIILKKLTTVDNCVLQITFM